MKHFARKQFFLSLLAVLFILHVVFFYFADRFSDTHAQISEEIPLQLISGTKTTIGHYRSKPLLVHFWATSCKTCIREMPELKKLYNRLQPKGFELLAVAMPYDRPDIVIAYASTLAMPWPVVLDVQGNTLSAFGRIQATPTSFLLDVNGRVVFKHVGKLHMAKLEKSIESLLTTGIQK